MRILFVTNNFPPDYTGGAEVSLYHTCRGLMQTGMLCTVLNISHRHSPGFNAYFFSSSSGMNVKKYASNDETWYAWDGIPVHRIRLHTHWPWSSVIDHRIVRHIRGEIRRLSPDIVHVHNVSGTSLAPFLACRLEGIPVLNTLHDLWLLCPNNMRYRRDGTFCDPATHRDTCRQCLRKYDYWADIPHRRRLFAALTANVHRFLSPSQAVIDRHVEAGYHRDRFRLLRNGMAEQPVPYTAPTKRPSTPPDASGTDSLTLLFAGGGVEIKGAQVILSALPHLATQQFNFRLLVAGGGDPGTLAAMRELSTHVQILGQVPFQEMRALYAAADLVLFPSLWHENAPMVIHESYQTGTPVAGSNFGAIPEWIVDGETGYLFAARDGAALADVVHRHAALPPHARRQMRHNCLVFARNRLSLSGHVATLTAVYRETLAATANGCRQEVSP